MYFKDVEEKIVSPWDYKQLQEEKKEDFSWKFICYATVLLEGTKILRKITVEEMRIEGERFISQEKAATEVRT